MDDLEPNQKLDRIQHCLTNQTQLWIQCVCLVKIFIMV